MKKAIVCILMLAVAPALSAQMRIPGPPAKQDSVAPNPTPAPVAAPKAEAPTTATPSVRTPRRSDITIPVSPKDSYIAGPRGVKTDSVFVPMPVAVPMSFSYEKPSWWKRNKKWALPTAVGVGALLGVKCAQGGFICGKTELKSNTEVTVIR